MISKEASHWALSISPQELGHKHCRFPLNKIQNNTTMKISMCIIYIYVRYYVYIATHTVFFSFFSTICHNQSFERFVKTPPHDRWVGPKKQGGVLSIKDKAFVATMSATHTVFFSFFSTICHNQSFERFVKTPPYPSHHEGPFCHG